MSTDIDRTIELSVKGMTCGHCVMSVTEELEEIPGVKNVEVILNPQGASRVTVLTDTPSVRAMAAAATATLTELAAASHTVTSRALRPPVVPRSV